MTEQVTQETQAAEDEDATIFVDDMHHLITLLSSWHANQVSTVSHFLNVPEGMEVSIEGHGEPFKLEGDALRAFRLGVELSLDYLGTLPFKAEYADAKAKH